MQLPLTFRSANHLRTAESIALFCLVVGLHAPGCGGSSRLELDAGSHDATIVGCDANPCVHGTCAPGVGAASCTCVAGYAGPTCATDVDDCASSPCEVGDTCIDGVASYRCTHFSADTDTTADARTGLVWQRVLDPRDFTLADASTFCSDLVLDGASDWRLPSMAELFTITDYDTTIWRVDESYFTHGPNQWRVWSATPYAATAGRFWASDPTNGTTDHFAATQVTSARCVRGSPLPSPSFTTTVGTVTDATSGLTWQRTAINQPLTRTEAAAYCASHPFDAGGPWRLPTIRELLTLIDFTASYPAIDSAVFTGSYNNGWFTTSTIYPTGDTSPTAPTYVWSIRFDDGLLGFTDDAWTSGFRCVR